VARAARKAEARSEHLLAELLVAQGWDDRRPPAGEVLHQHEYKDHPHLLECLRGRSKATGKGAGLPEAILIDRENLQPLAVIEAKADVDALDQAISEVTKIYGQALVDGGYNPLAISLAGISEDEFAVRVSRWSGSKWLPITYEGKPISWIPNRADVERLRIPSAPVELRPTVPPADVLAARADEINRLLRESGIQDQVRPGVVGAIMLALWQSKGNIRKNPEHILVDINEACRKAFWAAKKADLAASLRVDEANDTLAIKARRIVTILERLNITVLTAEHDYLGQLYETFFRYTGGNTIGQYFTPRHITAMMADLAEIGKNDIVLDPACGTGGFLVAAMNRVLREEKLSRTQMVKLVQKRLLGFDKEPITAALCVVNMILRGDGSTGVMRGDCFTSKKYPVGQATAVLMNPPFPHKNTDTPPDRFVDRALDGLRHRGRLAVIVPRSFLNKRELTAWRTKLLSKHTLNAVIVLPDELFQPYASSTTAILLITKGVPQDAKRPVFFARIDNDGFRLRKGVRRERLGSQIPKILSAYKHSKTVAGLCAAAEIVPGEEWSPGAYIPIKPLEPTEILDEARALIRSKTALVVKYAPQFRALRDALSNGKITPQDFREYVKGKSSVAGPPNSIAQSFEIYYGQKELETKDSLGAGEVPVISSSGAENGCYGFFDVDWVVSPPIGTAPRTGSIGHAHVQEWPCGVTSDCLVLLPRRGISLALLYVAAAVIRRERWRFDYSRKLTPERIARFPLFAPSPILDEIAAYLGHAKSLEAAAVKGIARGDTSTPRRSRETAPGAS
jgi:SAM-dependent methyltransferase